MSRDERLIDPATRQSEAIGNLADNGSDTGFNFQSAEDSLSRAWSIGKLIFIGLNDLQGPGTRGLG